MRTRSTLHIHLPGALVLRVRGRSVDAASEDPTSDLVARLRGALAEQGVTTHDDVGEGEGHWVTINGAHVFINALGEIVKGPAHLVGGNVKDHPQHKKIDVPAGGTKAKVHALLSAGHAFTLGELKEVLGGPPDKALANALAELKNPKWAGPKGALDIVKGPDGKYVVQPKAPKGALAVPEPPPAPEMTPPKGYVPPSVKPPPTAPAEEPAPEEEILEWEPGMPEEAKAAATIVPPPPEPVKLTKEQADEKYQGKLDAALKAAQQKAKATTPAEAHAIALAFKQEKAAAMAEWAQHVKGGEHKPKPQEVFKADFKLVDSLAQGMDPKEALAKWKADTQLEKQGLLDKPAATAPAPVASTPPSKVAPPPAQPAPVASSVPEAATKPTFAKVTDYVPDDHQGIKPEEIGKASAFRKQILELKGKLEAGHPDPVQNKVGVEKRLTARLKDSAAFNHVKKLYEAKKNGGYGLEAQLISHWAGSSGGHNPVSNAMQLAARDAFGMSKEHVDTTALQVLKSAGHDEESVWKQAANSLGVPYGHEHEKAALKAAAHDFILAQHAETQEHFKQLGIEHVYVARGMRTNVTGKASEVDLKLQPMSSFSANWGTAKQFSGGDGLYYVKVPVSQVMSTYVTGYGCSNEHELVVLAHPKMTAIEQKASGISGIDDAMTHLAQHLPGASQGKPGSAPAPTKPTMSAYELNDLSPSGQNTVTTGEHLHAEGDLEGLKKLHAQYMAVNPYGKTIGSHLEGLVKHLEAAQGQAATKPVTKPAAAPGVGKFKFAAPPAKPKGAKSTYAKQALVHAKAGDLTGVLNEQKLLEEAGGKYPASKKYIAELVQHVQGQLAAKEAHEAAAAALKAQAKAKPKKAAMHGTTPIAAKPSTPGQPPSAAEQGFGAEPPAHKTVTYMPGVPSHHLAHPHFDPVQYANWQAQGKTEFQIGKTLAAIKFAAKKKAEAAGKPYIPPNAGGPPA